MSALEDLMYSFFKKCVSATEGALPDVAYLAYLNAIDPTLAVSLVSPTLKNIKEVRYTHTTTGNITIDWANGNLQRIIMGGNHQITMPADPGDVGQSGTLIIECATYTPTWNSSPTIEWLTSNGAPPTLVTTANLVNVLTFIWDDTDTRWLGFLAGKETA